MEIAVSLLVLLNLLPYLAEAVLPNGECSAQNITCPFDDNFIDILREISSAEECREECENSVDCSVYTYPGTSPGGIVLSNTCNLFMDCLELKPIAGSCFTEEMKCDIGPTTTITTTSTVSTTITTTADTTTNTATADTTIVSPQLHTTWEGSYIAAPVHSHLYKFLWMYNVNGPQ